MSLNLASLGEPSYFSEEDGLVLGDWLYAVELVIFVLAGELGVFEALLFGEAFVVKFSIFLVDCLAFLEDDIAGITVGECGEIL